MVAALAGIAAGSDRAGVWGRFAHDQRVVLVDTLRGAWDLFLLCEGDPGALAKDLEATGDLDFLRLLPGEVVVHRPSKLTDPVRILAVVEARPTTDLVQRLRGDEAVETLFTGDGEVVVVLVAPTMAAAKDAVSALYDLGVERVTTALDVRILPEGELGGFQEALWRYRPDAGELIPLLQLAQDHYGYVPDWAVQQISAVSGVSASDVFGIVTFYAQFRLQPLGKYVIKQCHGTACHVNGAKELQEVMEEELGIQMGETDQDGLFTLEKVACLGCCSLAPVIMVNEETHGRLTPRKLRRVIRNYRKKARAAAEARS